MTFNNSISGSQRGADICVHFSPLLNLEPVFTLTNPLLAVTSQKAGSRHKRVNIIGQVKKSFLLSDVYVCVFSHIFSWIRSVLLDDQACPPFFVHVRLRSFGSMTPPFILTIPVLFLFILCCFRFDFLFVCFVSCLHVLCSSR